MKYKARLLIIVPFLLVFGACGSGGGNTSDTNSTGGSIEVVAVSGNMIDLTGTWKTTCYYNSDDDSDTNEEIVFNELTVTYTNTQYTSSDGSCTGTVTPQWKLSATVEASSSNSNIIEWRNGMDAVAPGPTTADPADATDLTLTDTEPFTALAYTLTEVTGISGPSVGDVAQLMYVIDDSGTAPIMYRGEYDNEQDLTGPYGVLADPFIKQ